jgi:hypothetical protein
MTANKFDIVVWMRETGSFPTLRDELLSLAGSEPVQSTSYNGMVDLHWGLSSLVDAERMAASLSQITSWPEIVLLRLSNYDNPEGLREAASNHDVIELSPEWPEDAR